MKPLFKKLSAELVNRNIRASMQRIKVLEYLIKNTCHPTVNQIFEALKDEIPTLSKTTIYNILNLFVKTGLVKLLTIEDNNARYDIITKTHGHFKCEECSGISDFNMDIDSIAAEGLNGFKVIDKNVYFKGVCPKCLLDANHNDRKEQFYE